MSATALAIKGNSFWVGVWGGLRPPQTPTPQILSIEINAIVGIVSDGLSDELVYHGQARLSQGYRTTHHRTRSVYQRNRLTGGLLCADIVALPCCSARCCAPRCSG